MCGFDKSWLPCAQQQDTFHHHKIAVHIILMVYAGIGSKRYPGCFCYGLFLRLVRHLQALGWSLNGSIFPGEQLATKQYINGWWIKLICVMCVIENHVIWCCLTINSFDIVFACHFFVLTTPYVSACIVLPIPLQNI